MIYSIFDICILTIVVLRYLLFMSLKLREGFNFTNTKYSLGDIDPMA